MGRQKNRFRNCKDRINAGLNARTTQVTATLEPLWNPPESRLRCAREVHKGIDHRRRAVAFLRRGATSARARILERMRAVTALFRHCCPIFARLLTFNDLEPLLLQQVSQYNRGVIARPDESGAAQRVVGVFACLLYTSPSPRDGLLSRMPSS